MDYEVVINWITIAGFILLGAFCLLGTHNFVYIVYALHNHTHFPKANHRYKYAVLIPARNESKVISHILESLKKQTYDASLFDVYVIVESEDDPTCQIVKEFGYQVVIRSNLNGRRTKGYALDDAVQHIKKTGKKYDAYLVFDADNILDSRFIARMNRVKDTGAQIGLGYRNSTNAQENWVTGCSSVLFVIMNSFGSKPKAHFIEKVTLSGTGYYLDCDVVEKEGGFIWNGLTEDTELTSYAYVHGLKCAYTEDAIYYDEQPNSMKVVRKQHIRWITGFIKTGHLYNKAMFKKYFSDDADKFACYDSIVGVWPVVGVVVTCVVYFLTMVVFSIMGAVDGSGMGFFCFWRVLVSLLVTMLPFIVVSLLAMAVEQRTLHFPLGFALLVSVMFFFYFIDFIPSFFLGLRKKNQNWDVITHSGKITSERIKKDKDTL